MAKGKQRAGSLGGKGTKASFPIDLLDHGLAQTPQASGPGNAAPPTVNTPNETGGPMGNAPVIGRDRQRITAVLPGASHTGSGY